LNKEKLLDISRSDPCLSKTPDDVPSSNQVNSLPFHSASTITKLLDTPAQQRSPSPLGESSLQFKI